MDDNNMVYYIYILPVQNLNAHSGKRIRYINGKLRKILKFSLKMAQINFFNGLR